MFLFVETLVLLWESHLGVFSQGIKETEAVVTTKQYKNLYQNKSACFSAQIGLGNFEAFTMILCR
jgi:hypothetical protein